MEAKLRPSFLLLVVVLTASCIGSSDASARVEALRSLPEAALRYPGSVELDTRRTDPEETIEGRLGAVWGYQLGSDEDASVIEAWYEERLEATGWVQGPTNYAIPTTDESSVRAWEKNDVVFRLSFLDKSRPIPVDPSARQYETIYEMRLMEDIRDDE
jgi:hypothetical protein